MNQLRSLFKRIGPAFILAAVVLGPGSITLNTIAGSQYGYELLWIIVLATVFMMAFTLMATRIGLATGSSLFDIVRKRYNPGVAKIGGLFGFLSILAFQAGNTAAVGFSLNALFGYDPQLWSIVLTIPALVLLVTSNLYRKLEFLVKIVVGIMLLTFLGTLISIGIDTESAIKGLLPGFPDSASIFLALGMSATTFSIAAAAYQSYLMKEKQWKEKDLEKQTLIDSLLGIAVLGSISLIILLTSAGVIAGGGEGGFTAQTMASQLEPLAGSGAFYLFTIGFFFASFSSLVVNPLIGATLLMDGFGKNPSMSGKGVQISAASILFSGILVVVLFGSSPIELLRVAQSMAIVAFPILGFLIIKLAADKKVMGNRVNGFWLNTIGGLGYLVILAIVFNYLRAIISGS